MMRYSIKQLADLAGISRRALRYYDEIGLLKPDSIGANGYRNYSNSSVYRLQQIMFYKELGFSLDEIHAALDDPQFDLLQALKRHQQALYKRRDRIERLLHTVELTINAYKGEIPMDGEQLFAGFKDEKEKHYAQEAVATWGDEAADSIRRWNAYGSQRQDEIREEGNTIYQDFTSLIGHDPASAPVQQIVKRWHDHLRYYYEPDKERLLGLADMYVDLPDFRKTFDQFDVQLATFMHEAIRFYCSQL